MKSHYERGQDDRRKGQLPFDGEDRRLAQRRSELDRRRQQRRAIGLTE